MLKEANRRPLAELQNLKVFRKFISLSLSLSVLLPLTHLAGLIALTTCFPISLSANLVSSWHVVQSKAALLATDQPSLLLLPHSPYVLPPLLVLSSRSALIKFTIAWIMSDRQR